MPKFEVVLVRLPLQLLHAATGSTLRIPGHATSGRWRQMEALKMLNWLGACSTTGFVAILSVEHNSSKLKQLNNWITRQRFVDERWLRVKARR